MLLNHQNPQIQERRPWSIQSYKLLVIVAQIFFFPAENEENYIKSKLLEKATVEGAIIKAHLILKGPVHW